MTTHSVTVYVPDTRPYDQHFVWLHSFVGNILMPVIALPCLGRFWFSGYGGIKQNKHAKFRFETTDLSIVVDALSISLQAAGLRMPAVESYDVADDIGKGDRSRFLGTNAKHGDHVNRGKLAFDFLHASACLMLDCLIGPDGNGYWQLEEGAASGYSHESSLEQYHHLFCNMTVVPTFIAIGQPPGGGRPLPLTSMECAIRDQLKLGWFFSDGRKGMF